MTLQLLIPILLQIAGALVLIAEIIIPSGGVLTVLSVGLLGYALYLVFTTVSSFAGMTFVLADIIMLPVILYFGIKLLAKSPVTLKTVLSKAGKYSSQPEELDTYSGKQGLAITNLRPAGAARIDGKRVDVVSRGEYIEKGTSIVVIQTEGNRVVVRAVES